MEEFNFGDSMKKLIRYCRKYYFPIVVAFMLSIFGTTFNIIGPDRLKEVTNKIAEGIVTNAMDVDGILKIVTILTILYVLGFLFNTSQGIIMATCTQKITNKMRKDISYKINKIPLKYFDQTTVGDTLSRVTNDVDTIGQSLNQSIGTLVSGITMFFGSLFMMTKTNWIMTLSGVVATIIGFIVMILITKKSQKYFGQQQEELGHLNGLIEETYTGHNVIVAYNDAHKEITKFNEINENLYSSAWKSQFLSGLMMPLMTFIGNLGYVAVCVTGAILVEKDMTEIGTIVAFMMYIRLFTQPLAQMAQAITSLQATAAASGRVFKFLREDELEDESHKTDVVEDVKGHIEFNHVSFGYTDDKIIINDFNLEVKPGEKVAIVGPTGAGKSTLVNLLMRFYETNSGTIKIDGKNIKDLKREQVHSMFGMVLQDTWLFEGTIKDNIRYNLSHVSDEQIIKASKAVGLDKFVRALPNAYDTVLDDKTTLSAGQKQLITIARAYVLNAPMLILDEATSSVDTRTELIIQKAMDKLAEGRTCFVIAHRLSTIKNANTILVLKNGSIIEHGNHEQLLELGGFYADLYNSQFEIV
ncbi:ABC transporter ATP-binding protein [Lachnobacterium bovis]|uniref:ATP-binding cassette, subfamily B n=1 Tax=Lachnobacterium bovis TaxID=140626 RepID=A0A1H9PR31_9FIRM|nr:ABC transporter ATP-binding protein [Lachnobacterium bovis]SER50796.1 ATP-binding cassette, subfamily B [Lachnobacterium bovis]